MVSDFIDEYTGFLALNEDKYTQGKIKYPDLQREVYAILKYGSDHDGYWNSEKFLTQLEAAIKIAMVKYSPHEYIMYIGFLIIALGIRHFPKVR